MFVVDVVVGVDFVTVVDAIVFARNGLKQGERFDPPACTTLHISEVTVGRLDPGR